MDLCVDKLEKNRPQRGHCFFFLGCFFTTIFGLDVVPVLSFAVLSFAKRDDDDETSPVMEEEAVETEGVETTEDEVVEHEVGLEVEWFCISGIGGII